MTLNRTAGKLAAWLELPEARLRDVKPGDVLVVDGDFTCIRPWTKHIVQADKDGGLFIACKEGGHRLDGQLACDNPDGEEDDDTLVGLRREA